MRIDEEKEAFADLLEAAADAIRRENYVRLPHTTTLHTPTVAMSELEFEVSVEADGELLDAWSEYANALQGVDE